MNVMVAVAMIGLYRKRNSGTRAAIGSLRALYTLGGPPRS
jgi:hypothetical protein